MEIIYTGHVQGVGFRYTVRSIAPGYEICGTIKNLATGEVELIAEGAKPELEAFAQDILESGLGRLIRHTRVNWSEARHEFKGFAIVG